MWKHFARLFVANDCLGCERMLTSQEQFLCLQCLSQMEETHFHESWQENELYYRLAGRVPLSGAASLFYFDKGGRLQRVIQQLKYQSMPQVGTYLGKYYGNRLQGSGSLPSVDAIVPVPLHARRLRQRGYNQAEQIARGLGKVLEIPVQAQLLKRKRHTAKQAQKAGTQRWENVAGAFQAAKQIPRSVLLVDDVITMGATMGACLEALFAAEQPPKEVYVLSVGMTRKSG
ncbi:MAG: ComF family protein [Bacteroidota bacterium]